MTEYMNHSYQKYDLSFRKDITDAEIENLSETSPNLNELNIAGSKNIKGAILYKLAGVFRKLQTPAAPHPGQALLGAAENCENLTVINLSFFRNLISKENLLNFFSGSQ